MGRKRGQNGAAGGATPGRALHSAAVDQDNQGISLMGCPHFALSSDPETSLLFPSPEGFCYWAAPPASPALSHQQMYCLSSNHRKCPILGNKQRLPLPRDLAEPAYRGGLFLGRLPPLTVGQLLAALIILVFAVAAGWLLLTFRKAPTPEVVVPIDNTVPEATRPTASTSNESMADADVEAMPTSAAATATTLPTFTATPRSEPSQTPVALIMPSPLLTATPLPSPTLPPTARVVTSSLGVRTGPSGSYSLLEPPAEVGTELEITGRSADGEWWQLCCVEGQIGWLSTAEAQTAGDAAAVPIVPAPLPQALVLVPALNVRTGPGLGYPVIATSALDTRFDVVARVPDSVWWQVCCVDGDTGWVFGAAINVVGSAEFVPIVSDSASLPTPEP